MAGSTMDENIWRNLPEILYSQIVACLPMDSVLRLRSVSKEWNDIPLGSLFQAQRPSLCRDFMELVCVTYGMFDEGLVVSWIEGLLCIGDGRDEIYVVDISKLSVTRIASLDRTLTTSRCPVDMVVDSTGNFNTFMQYRLTRNVGKGTNPVFFDRFDSSKSIWYSCGGLYPPPFKSISVDGVVQHSGRHVILVEMPIETYPYQFKVHDKSKRSWGTLPGQVPLAGKTRPLFFRHKGRLLLATMLLDRFLWEYVDGRKGWVPVGPIRVEGFEKIGLEELKN